jgi:hypothetical protein
VLLTLAVSGTAQTPLVLATIQHGPITATKDGLTLAAGEFAVTDLIEAVAGFLCRNYLYDLTAVEKAPGFRLQRTIALDALGSEELLYALLASRDFVVLPLDELRGLHQIVSLAKDPQAAAANIPWRSVDDVLQRPRLRELAMVVVPLQFADARLIANGLRAQFSLQGMWQPGMPTASASDARWLVLHGFRDQIVPVIQLAQLIDAQHRPSAQPPSELASLQARVGQLEAELTALRAELARLGDKR